MTHLTRTPIMSPCRASFDGAAPSWRAGCVGLETGLDLSITPGSWAEADSRCSFEAALRAGPSARSSRLWSRALQGGACVQEVRQRASNTCVFRCVAVRGVCMCMYTDQRQVSRRPQQTPVIILVESFQTQCIAGRTGGELLVTGRKTGEASGCE